jgi:hypothetical protein
VFSSTRRAAWTRWLTSSRAMSRCPECTGPRYFGDSELSNGASYVAGFDIGGKNCAAPRSASIRGPRRAPQGSGGMSSLRGGRR